MNCDLSTKTLHYKGIHFTDLIARKVSDGGNVTNVEYTHNDNSCVVTLTTDYIDGLTIVKDVLHYDATYNLISWDMKFEDGETKKIFCRDTFNYYISQN